MSKYKVGDKVKVREDLIGNRRYGGLTFIGDMIKLKGKEVTIESTYDYDNIDKYRIEEEEIGYTWTNEMFEPVVEQPKYVKCINNDVFKNILKIGQIYQLKYECEDFDGTKYKLVGDEFNDYIFYSSRLVPVSSPQTKSTKSVIKIRQVGDTTYATYGKNTGKATRNSLVDRYDDKIGKLISISRALGFSEEKVKSIIDVLFDNEDTKAKYGCENALLKNDIARALSILDKYKDVE